MKGKSRLGKRLFITGTGTDVGKTFISGLIVKKLLESGAKTAYFKAAMSGNDVGRDGRLIPGDAVAIQRLSGTTQSLESMCPFVYKNAVSPHLAARWEGRPFDLDVAERCLNRLCEEYDYVVIEGAGGIVCPIRYDDVERLLLVDLIQKWGTPCLLVADSGLGTINSATLTAWALAARRVSLRGVIFNRWTGDPMQEDNALMCERLAETRVIAKVAEDATTLDLDLERLTDCFL